MENGHTNGHHPSESAMRVTRFSDIPSAIDIPVGGGRTDEAVELNLEELPEDPTELCDLLDAEEVAKGYWTTIALAYAKQRKMDLAEDIVNKGLAALGRSKPEDKLGLYHCLCWLQLIKIREAPRTRLDPKADPDVKTKDFYQRAAIAALNDASRISPSYPPLFLARGVLCLLRAALLPDQTEKLEMLRQAVKCFDDSLRSSKGRNMFAMLGRARAQYSMGKFGDALGSYQRVLEHAPEMSDPDPRIGIGCCFWALGHKDDAQVAWQRVLDINPSSKVATVLLGLYRLNVSSQLATSDPKFTTEYQTAHKTYTQQAWKLDNSMPLANSTFGSYFLNMKSWKHVDKLARTALELTDINAIASDGWYLLARLEHDGDDLSKANDYYSRADQARGGDERGWLPAKFGLAQIRVLQNDLAGAKFRLEKIVQQSKNIEALSLLGALYAEEAFSPPAGTLPEEVKAAGRKAIAALETVRMAWKDTKKHLDPDPQILLKLARLYEHENPDRSLQCLQQVEDMALEDLPEELRPENAEDEEATKMALREYLPPQLLNNIGCFHFQSNKLGLARDMFQTALKACGRLGAKDSTLDTDALATTIMFNLARTLEAEGMLDDAKQILEGTEGSLLAQHPDYVDARLRLAYIGLRQSPGDEGPKLVRELVEAYPSNLEVRALFGWYIRKAKKKTSNIAEDQEERHYKHTLRDFANHDCYAWTGIANVYLTHAREMPRNTDQEKDRRRKMYEKAVEMFDKALQLDPQNAYAAQGIAIAVVEDKKDFSNALQIFTKIKESIKDASVHTNLGHIYCELNQYSRAIENYDAALKISGLKDPQVLACLGRVWLMKGKQGKSLHDMQKSLDYSQRALEVAADQVHFQFNVAFVQIQIAQLVYSLPEAQRTLEEVEQAANGLDAAIESLMTIAKSPNPPFPRNDIEQRANMGRNTMRKQLERAAQSQREYEDQNAARLQQAREQREAEVARRQEEKRAAEAKEEERKQAIAEARQQMQEEDRKKAADRIEEVKRKEADLSTDEETGEKKKRPKRQPTKRKKKGDTADSEVDDAEQSDRQRSGKSRSASRQLGDDEEKPRKKKKRKLERRSTKENSKYKSSERIVDSDEDDDLPPIPDDLDANEDESNANGVEDGDGEAPAPRRKATRVVDDDDEADADAAENGEDADAMNEDE